MGKIYKVQSRRNTPGVLALCAVIAVLVVSGLASRTDLAPSVVAPARASAGASAPGVVEYFPAHFTLQAAPAEPIDTF